PTALRQFRQLDVQRHAAPVSHDFYLHALAHIFAVEHAVEVVLLADCLPVNLRDDVAQSNSVIVAAAPDDLGVSQSVLIGPRPGNDCEDHQPFAYRQIESLDQPRPESAEWNHFDDAHSWLTHSAICLDVFDNLPRRFDRHGETDADRAARR